MYCCVFDRWIPQSVMALYIYRVGWTCPVRNPITDLKSMKITSCTRILLISVRPVGSCRISYSTQTGQAV